MKIKELFNDDSKWCKDALATNIDNDIVDPNSPTATRWCLAGAIFKCYPPERRNEIEQRIRIRIGMSFNLRSGDKVPISLWNDDKDRTFEQIKDLIESLDI